MIHSPELPPSHQHDREDLANAAWIFLAMLAAALSTELSADPATPLALRRNAFFALIVVATHALLLIKWHHCPAPPPSRSPLWWARPGYDAALLACQYLALTFAFVAQVTLRRDIEALALATAAVATTLALRTALDILAALIPPRRRSAPPRPSLRNAFATLAVLTFVATLLSTLP